MTGAMSVKKISFREKSVNVLCCVILLAISCFVVFWLGTVIYLLSQGNKEGIFWGIIISVTIPAIARLAYEADLLL